MKKKRFFRITPPAIRTGEKSAIRDQELAASSKSDGKMQANSSANSSASARAENAAEEQVEIGIVRRLNRPDDQRVALGVLVAFHRGDTARLDGGTHRLRIELGL